MKTIKSFEIKCPHCGTAQRAMPSLAQLRLGKLDAGRGSCLYCHKIFILTLAVDDSNQPISMTAAGAE